MKRINKGPKKKCKYIYNSCDRTCSNVYELFWDRPRAENSSVIICEKKVCPPFKVRKLCKKVKTGQKKKSLFGLVK